MKCGCLHSTYSNRGQWDVERNVLLTSDAPACARFHAKVFEDGGVEASKIVVVPEPADVDFFNPLAATPLELPSESLAGRHAWLVGFSDMRDWCVCGRCKARRFQVPVCLQVGAPEGLGCAAEGILFRVPA